MLSTAAATTRFVSSGNRLPVLRRAMDYWRFLNSPTLPEKFLVDLFPEVDGLTVPVSVDVRHHFELPYGERTVVAAIVAGLKPQVLFEFGTYTGATTRLIADACPAGAVVHTLDLPAAELTGTAVSDTDIGARFKGRPEYASRIVQHRINSRAFDPSPFHRQVDLVYIDASHQFEDVLHDSRLGLTMLKPGGVMLWDDYHVNSLPVAEALDVLGREVPLARIFHTRIAAHRSRV
jgi:predicted O-methyltransferase YrrM